MTLLDSLRAFFLKQGMDNTFWIAYSGGLDSHVLMSLCTELRKSYPLKLQAIHIHHGLSPQASAWAAHCEFVSSSYQINLLQRSVQVMPQVGESLEEVAREKRYVAFAEYLSEGDVLLTAHQQDDQAETILLQLFRGAGPKGLAGMPMMKPFANGFHARPLLSFARAQLEEYASAQGLKWIEDESNQQTALTRNYIRHELMGVLKTRWPTITDTIARSGAHCAETQALLEEYILADWKNAEGSQTNTLSVQKLLQLNPARQRQVLRYWIQHLSYPLPDTKKIIAIQQDVLTADWDRLPLVSWRDTELRRYRDDLFLMPIGGLPAQEAQYRWGWSEPLVLSEVGTLEADLVKGGGFSQRVKEVSVRFRRGGEMVELPNRGRHSLKNLFQEWGVLPWERGRIPLLFDGEVLIGIPGYFVHGDYQAGSGEEGWVVSFRNVAWTRFLCPG